MLKTLRYLTIGVCILLTGCFNCNSWIEKEIKPNQYDGIIISISEEPCFKHILIEQNKEEKELTFCECGENEIIWKEMKVGDTLVKERGSTIIFLKHQTGKVVEFEYPCCDH